MKACMTATGRTLSGVTGPANETEQAVGRLVGALCAVTARDEDAQSGMLASWISQVTAALHDSVSR